MTTNRSLLDRNDPTRSHIVTYGRHIGRVGALAAALGIGLMVATSPGVASADSTNPDSTSPSGGTSGADSNTQASNTGTTDAGTTSTETGTAVGSSAATSTTGTGSSPSSTATDTTTNSAASSSSIQVAPGVTISANSIKIGSKTITLDLGAEKTPTSVKPPAGEVIEPAGSAPPVLPAPETGQTASRLLKTESKSTHDVTGNAATASLTTAVSKLATSVEAGDDALKSVKQLSAKLAESSAAPIAEALKANTASSAVTALTATAAIAPVAPTTQVAAPATGAVGFLNQVVTNLLKPFLAPAPNTPQPVNPVVWAVLGWVRRNVFNQAPTIEYNPETTTQTGQTVTGNIGAVDPEGDRLTYTVTGATPVAGSPSTWKTDKGTLAIDQATGKFTYTPDDINYTGVQTDSFTVSVTDGKLPNGKPLPPRVPTTLVRSDTETINLTVQPPTATRVILDVPGIDKPWTPRYSADGKTIYFTGTPTGTTRSELYQIKSDGTGTATCMSCGLSPDINVNLFKPVPTADGSGRVLVQLETAKPRAVIYEPVGYNGNTTAKLVEDHPAEEHLGVLRLRAERATDLA